MESGDAPYVRDVLDEIEAEVAASAVVPVSGQIALNPERMAALIERLRAAVSAADALAADDTPHREALRRAEAEAALIVEEARRKAELLLDGTRVSNLREEHVQAIIRESRQRGEELVNEAYEYGLGRMEEVQARAEDARRLVREARDKVVVEGGGLAQVAQVARGAARGLFGGFLRRQRG
jgi:cell division septum initiation protein DivIVA